MEDWEGEGYFFLYFHFGMWDLGAINTELMASKLTPALPLRSRFFTTTTNSSCEGNEDTGHFVAHREISRTSSNVLTHIMPLLAGQGAASTNFHLSNWSF